MTLNEVRQVLGCEVVSGEENLDVEVRSACGSDMMSDVLAFVKEQGLLLTGLVNPQVVRTAEMMDMRCIVFVRGKKPDELMKKLAAEKEIVLMTTPLRMYSACGILYSHGLHDGEHTV